MLVSCVINSYMLNCSLCNVQLLVINLHVARNVRGWLIKQSEKGQIIMFKHSEINIYGWKLANGRLLF